MIDRQKINLVHQTENRQRELIWKDIERFGYQLELNEAEIGVLEDFVMYQRRQAIEMTIKIMEE